MEKSELRKQRDVLADSYAFVSGPIGYRNGFDTALDLVWPEIERLRNSMTTGDRNWTQLIEQKDKYEDQVYHATRRVEELEQEIERCREIEKCFDHYKTGHEAHLNLLRSQVQDLQRKLNIAVEALSMIVGNNRAEEIIEALKEIKE